MLCQPARSAAVPPVTTAKVDLHTKSKQCSFLLSLLAVSKCWLKFCGQQQGSETLNISLRSANSMKVATLTAAWSHSFLPSCHCWAIRWGLQSWQWKAQRRGESESESSVNPGIFRGLVDFVASLEQYPIRWWTFLLLCNGPLHPFVFF